MGHPLTSTESIHGGKVIFQNVDGPEYVDYGWDLKAGAAATVSSPSHAPHFPVPNTERITNLILTIFLIK